MVLKGAEESGFEEVIFILREDGGLTSREFLEEAERIAGEYAEAPDPRSGRLLWILSGLSLALSLSWVLYFIFA
ncbi:MAG: hypothetical protein IKZ21_02000 [Clostridia bacterium]|nr:hypothetical protein [Clostridia bacterium]